MLYVENTTLFELSNLNYKALISKIRNSKKDFKLKVDLIEPLLKNIQKEAIVFNKIDFPIDFTLSVSSGLHPSIEITLIQNLNLLPHVSNVNKPLRLILDLNSFNSSDSKMLTDMAINNYCDFKPFNPLHKSFAQCYEYSLSFIAILRKMDSLFKCDNQLSEAVYQHGIYPEKNKVSCNSFNVLFSHEEMMIESKAKRKVKSDENKALFSIRVKPDSVVAGVTDINFIIDIYGQMITLSYHEFMEADNSEIESLFISILKLKGIGINDIHDFKNELTIQEMIAI